MAKVKVYKYRTLSATSGNPRLGKYMGTERFIKLIGGWKVEGSGIEVDRSQVNDLGQTVDGFVVDP